MSYLDHIHYCNNFEPEGHRPFLIGAAQLGWVRDDLADRLREFTGVFAVQPDHVALEPVLADIDERSRAVDAAMRVLRDEGAIRGWRGELYAVAPKWGAEPLLRIERAICPLLGIRAWGVHLTGFVRKADGLHMWIGRRAKDKPTYPGMLDNMVAGGQPHGLSLHDNLLKEAAEEANVPAALAAQARAVGVISYRHAVSEGVKPDQMFCFDLELPEDFTPENTDGELESFALMPVEEVAAIVRDTADFKFNCNLVIIDFLIRQGYLHPDNEPDYAALCLGLRVGEAL